MKRKRILILIFLLVIGFAAASTTLVMNGLVGIASNNNDFNIIFTSAKLNNEKRNDFIDKDRKKTITFESNKLTMKDETAILDYEVTNTSKNYDGDVEIVCKIVDEAENIVEENKYIDLEYEPNSMIVEAGKKKNGKIIAKQKKVTTEDMNIKIKCSLNATAKERNTSPEESLPFDVITGDGTNIGDEVCLGEECFYVISNNGYEIKLLAKYNLYVGGGYETGPYKEYGEEATRKQDARMKGTNSSGPPSGTIAYSTMNANYETSLIKPIVDEYTNFINEENGIKGAGGLLTTADLVSIVGQEISYGTKLNELVSDKEWLYDRSYWMDGKSDGYVNIMISPNGQYSNAFYPINNSFGVRPVITIEYKRCEGICHMKGDGTKIGDEICLDEECFYVIENDGKEMKLFAKNNLYVGNIKNRNTLTEIGVNEPNYGLQNIDAKGRTSSYDDSNFEFIGVTKYSDWAGNYSGSLAEKYANNYAKMLSQKYNLDISGNLITMEQISKVANVSINRNTKLNSIPTVPQWIYSSSYWTKTFAPRSYNYPAATTTLLAINEGGDQNETYEYREENYFGIRPVVTIPLKAQSEICNGNLCYIDKNEDGKASVGEEITIGTEIFYVISNDDKKLRAIAKYNLEVGTVNGSNQESENVNAQQNKEFKAYGYELKNSGGVVFSNYNTEYGASNVENYVNNYVDFLNKRYNLFLKGDIITIEELQSLNNLVKPYSYNNDLYFESVGPDYLYSSSYWTKSIKDPFNKWVVNYQEIKATPTIQYYSTGYGVRPVIEIELENTCNGNICYNDSDKDGNINLGDEVCIGTECFYIMAVDNDNIKMLAKYNLNIGNYNNGKNILPIENPTGLQNASMKGSTPQNYSGGINVNGTVKYHDELKNQDVYYENSNVKGYVDQYTSYMNEHYNINASGDIMTLEDLARMAGLEWSESTTLEDLKHNAGDTTTEKDSGLYEGIHHIAILPHWVYGTSYWLKTKSTTNIPHTITSLGIISHETHLNNYKIGVRPVLTISKDLLRN